jgi:hypothetical protein
LRTLARMCYTRCMSRTNSGNLLTETLPVNTIKTLLGDGGGAASASELRDRLVKVAGNKKQLVELMDAVNSLSK